MMAELWFYLTTVLICAGYAALMQHYPRWKPYFSLGFLAFTVGGGALVYFHAKEEEDLRGRIDQMQAMLDTAKKEKEIQESLTREASDRARLLAEQLRMKNEEFAKLLKDEPLINGEIKAVRIFPWQRASPSQTETDDMMTTTGFLIFVRVRNDGATATLSDWDLSIELPDRTIITPQEVPPHGKIRVQCEDGAVAVSKAESLDTKRTTLRKATESSGVTVWMVKLFPLKRILTTGSFYTLTVRDDRGVLHALARYQLASLPQKCFGFDVLD
ncbi:MAG TPA: hypothetical protein VFS39_00080 [Nitrospira sp.]|nr:hypothetical protein [Nitrospira sp.]